MGAYHQLLFHGVSSNFVFGAPASTLRGSGSFFRFGFIHCAKKEVAGGTGTRMMFADQKGEKISALEVHRGYNCYFRSYMDDIYIFILV